MTVSLMIDFETLSLKDNAVLLSLGACAFDPATGEIVSTFYAAIDPRTQHGRDISASTVLWWLEQDEAARKKITQAVKNTDALDAMLDVETPEANELAENACIPINHAAMAFIAYVESLGQENVECWSNGAVDHTWLQSLMDYTGYKNPIKFWNQRDYRTMKALHPDVECTALGQLHNALDDAMRQAHHTVKIMQHAGLVGEKEQDNVG